MFQRIGQAFRGAALMDFVGAFGLGMKYMIRPKATVLYPNERGPQSPRSPLTCPPRICRSAPTCG